MNPKNEIVTPKTKLVNFFLDRGVSVGKNYKEFSYEDKRGGYVINSNKGLITDFEMPILVYILGESQRAGKVEHFCYLKDLIKHSGSKKSAARAKIKSFAKKAPGVNFDISNFYVSGGKERKSIKTGLIEYMRVENGVVYWKFAQEFYNLNNSGACYKIIMQEYYKQLKARALRLFEILLPQFIDDENREPFTVSYKRLAEKMHLSRTTRGYIAAIVSECIEEISKLTQKLDGFRYLSIQDPCNDNPNFQFIKLYEGEVFEAKPVNKTVPPNGTIKAPKYQEKIKHLEEENELLKNRIDNLEEKFATSQQSNIRLIGTDKAEVLALGEENPVYKAEQKLLGGKKTDNYCNTEFGKICDEIEALIPSFKRSAMAKHVRSVVENGRYVINAIKRVDTYKKKKGVAIGSWFKEPDNEEFKLYDHLLAKDKQVEKQQEESKMMQEGTIAEHKKNEAYKTCVKIANLPETTKEQCFDKLYCDKKAPDDIKLAYIDNLAGINKEVIAWQYVTVEDLENIQNLFPKSASDKLKKDEPVIKKGFYPTSSSYDTNIKKDDPLEQPKEGDDLFAGFRAKTVERTDDSKDKKPVEDPLLQNPMSIIAAMKAKKNKRSSNECRSSNEYDRLKIKDDSEVNCDKRS